MALKLDDNLLVELGLGALPAEEKRAFLGHIYEKLEMNVGVRLAEQMSEQQLMEFEQLINSGDDTGAFQWLERTFPGYKDVVADEFEKLKYEVRQVAPQILASSQQQTVPTPVGPAAAQQPMPAEQYSQPSAPQQPAYAPPQQQPAQTGYGQVPQQGQSADTQQPPMSPSWTPPPQQ